MGGFGATSLDGDQDDDGDRRRSDDDIAEGVRRAFRSDALTADLQVDVGVRRGVVHLRGRVQTFDDAENAEVVAGRVRSGREVREEFEIASLI